MVTEPGSMFYDNLQDGSAVDKTITSLGLSHASLPPSLSRYIYLSLTLSPPLLFFGFLWLMYIEIIVLNVL